MGRVQVEDPVLGVVQGVSPKGPQMLLLTLSKVPYQVPAKPLTIQSPTPPLSSKRIQAEGGPYLTRE